MPKPRTKWSTTTVPGLPRRSHPSQAAAYRHVQSMAVQFHAGILRPDLTRVKVWVDVGTGRGWDLYETLDLAELPGVVAE